MDDRIPQFADTVTAGLKDDPELRLDIRREVITHLEDASADHAEAEDPAAEALRVFGSAEAVAEELLAANARRMTVRAWVRRALRFVAVPLALVLGMCLGGLGTAHFLAPASSMHMVVREALPPELFGPPPDFFARTKPTYAIPLADQTEELRAYRRAHPENKMMLAYGAFGAVNGHLNSRELVQFEEEMREGKRLEPDNAVFNYALAEQYLQMACKELPPEAAEGRPWIPSGMEGQEATTYGYVLWDADAAAKCLQELREGMAKPRLHFYHDEMAQLRIRGLPHVDTLDAHLRILLTYFDEMLPEGPRLLDLLRRAPACGELLGKVRPGTDIEPCLRLWERMTVQKCSDTGLLILFSFGGWQQAAVAYERRGMPDRAAEVRRQGSILRDAYKAYWNAANKRDQYVAASRPPDLGHYSTYSYHRRAGLLAGTFLTMVPNDWVSKAEMAPSRALDYHLAEWQVIDLVLVVLGIAVLLAAAGGLVNVLVLRRRGVSPVLLLPDFREVARIAILGVVLPLAAYLAYAYSPWAGRDTSLATHLPRVLAELAVLALALIITPMMLAFRGARRRSKFLGLKGAVARAAMVRLALAAVVLAGIACPCLYLREAVLVRADHLVFHDAQGNDVPMALQARTVARQKALMLDAAAKAGLIDTRPLQRQ